MNLTQADQGSLPQVSAALPLVGPPDAAYLRACVRHLVFRALETARGDGERLSVDTRLLLRPGPDPDAEGEIVLGPDGVGLDSLAMMSAATAVSRFFDLGTSGVDDHLLFAESVGDWATLIAKHFALQGSTARITFETSGSTDAPSLVTHPLTDLCAEVAALVAGVIPPETARIVALCPPQHIYGFLFTVLLPSHLDLPVLDAVAAGPGHTVRQLRRGDLVIGTPHNWQTLLDYGAALPDGVSGVTSGAPMPESLWQRATNAGLLSMTEVFGSTETGGIGARRAADAPFTLLPHLHRDGDGVRADGRLLPLQDRFTWHDARRFRPTGRVDHAVQVAGVNVSLQKVRAILCESPDVADAAVRLDADRLKAFIVPADPAANETTLLAHLRAHLDGRLAPVARPRSYRFGPSLPRNAMGKLQDWSAD